MATTLLNVCATCRTRITQIQPSGLWIHARAPRPWHAAVPVHGATTAFTDRIDSTTRKD